MARSEKTRKQQANGSRNGDDVEGLLSADQRWEETTLQAELSAKPETKDEFRTLGGDYLVKRQYTPADVADHVYERDSGWAGQYPFTRGRYAAGYRNFEWPHDFYTGFGDSSDANERYRELVSHGANWLTLAMDLPTQLGYDPDHPMAFGEVGRAGVAVSSLKDAEQLFDGIPLDQVGLSTVGNCIGPYALALFQSAGEAKGFDPKNMRVRLQNDPLKEYTGRGTYIFGVPIAVELATDVVEYIIKEQPQWVPQYVCSTQVRWGGVTPAEEIAFGISNFVTYVDAGLRRGLELEQIVPTMDLHMSTDGDLFEEAAKFRAARKVYAKFMKRRYACDDPKVLGLRITTYTNGTLMTALQPLNNTVRASLQVLAAILGGVEHIWAPAYDEALGLPTYESTRVAQLTKQIIHHESGVANTVDPLGGSYFVEDLTARLEKDAERLLDQVESMGGAVKAIDAGLYDERMVEGTVTRQREVDAGNRVVVGVNKFVEEEEPVVPVFQVAEDTAQRQVERVQKLRDERDAATASKGLANLRDACQRKAETAGHNIVPAMLDAVRSYCTAGEIFEVMREAFGQHQPSRAA